jgi:acetate kinase
MNGKNQSGYSCFLSVNRGSSSLKFALFRLAGQGDLKKLLTGNIAHIDQPEMNLAAQAFNDSGSPAEQIKNNFERSPDVDEVNILCDCINGQIEKRASSAALCGVGHRVVHGGPKFWQPQIVTADLLAELRRLSPFDPEHLPAGLSLIESFQKRFPALPQVACFDTAFHFHMPRVAQILPIPRKFFEKGIRRYGFHGLSYSYLLEELERIAGKDASRQRIVMAHLGAGASLAAVVDGHSMDTSMSFTPTAGIPMATRTGDLDPALAAYLVRNKEMTFEEFHDMINRSAGMFGVSETTGDMRDLLEREASDPRAADAVAMFCYEVKKRIGSYASAMGGIDTLIFSGGIGEHAPQVRERACQGLSFLGIEIDPHANQAGAAVISTGRVSVRVMVTDEELMIARSVREIVGK